MYVEYHQNDTWIWVHFYTILIDVGTADNKCTFNCSCVIKPFFVTLMIFTIVVVVDYCYYYCLCCCLVIVMDSVAWIIVIAMGRIVSDSITILTIDCIFLVSFITVFIVTIGDLLCYFVLFVVVSAMIEKALV